MKKNKFLLILFIVILILTGAKMIFLSKSNSKIVRKGKDGKNVSVPVSVYVIPKYNPTNKLYAPGTIIANEQIELRPEVSGRVTYLYLPEGEWVKEGSLLLKINDADLLALHRKVLAQVKQLYEDAARQKRLLQVEGTTRQTYELALSSLESCRADSAYQQALIAKTEIRAPFSGVLGIKNISIGGYVTPNTIIAQLQEINPIKIDFNLPEKYVGLFNVGDKIEFRREGSTEVYSAQIVVKDPYVDINNRSLHYRAMANNRYGVFLPGSYVQVSLDVKQLEKSVFVPTEAIVPVEQGKKIFKIKNGLAEEVMVITGLRTADYIQILDNVYTGDSIIVSGHFQLKNQSKVIVRQSR